ncbi:ribonuclease H-like domain-containing protein [Tanacetum coccineum]|uniref:Ribonuclease H-like domain-containing protein n=1 Tax=Tanacetum coccineum TaxID=301880 RepID=A0ABQ5GQL6_9ASTR
MLAIPHLSQVSSMAKIDSKEAQMKSKAGICFGLSSHNKHTSFLLSKEAQAASDVESARVIIESLDEFKLTSGLVPSIPKSTTFFCNVLNHVKIAILNIMPFSEGELPIKYLGVPLISSRLLNKDCKVLVEKAKNRIGDWKNKSLSFAGRLQLCKPIISSMHIYWASVLAIPKGIIFDIQNLIRGFLWCNGDYERGKAKVAWVDICLPLSEGGLGLRSLKGCSLWDIPIKADVSRGRRKLLQLRDRVRPYMWFKIGNGEATSIWFDYWCDHCPLSRFLSSREISNAGYNTCSKVSDLMVHNAWNWPSSWLIKAPELGLVPTPSIQMDTSDVLQWRDSNESISEFSVKKVWEAIRPRGEEVDWYRMVWFPHCVPRHAFLLWLVMRNSLKTQDRLKQWDVAAAIYFIWIERNNRLFKDIKKNPEELCDMIMITELILLMVSLSCSDLDRLEGSGVASCSYGAPSDCVVISMPKCLSGLHLLMYSTSYVWLADIAAWKFFKAN